MLNKKIRYKQLIYILLFLSSCQAKNSSDTYTLPYYMSADFKPYWFANTENAHDSVTHQLGKFSFFNQQGATITEEFVHHKIHVANFFFTTCPGICPMMSKELEKVQKAYINDDQLVILSFSVDPKNDSIEALKNYAALHEAKENKWQMLTGKKEDIYRLGRQFYYAEKEEGLGKDTSRFLHTENLVLVDQHGYIRGIYNGTQPIETERLITDIKRLKESEE